MKKVLLLLILACCSIAAFAGETGAGGDVDPSIVGRWRWIGVTLGADTIETGEDSANYLITFEADGSFKVLADCRSGSGRYTADGTMLTLSLNNMTKMNCEVGSLAPELEQLLTDVTNFRYTLTVETQLDLNFAAGTGKAQFIKTNDAM